MTDRRAERKTARFKVRLQSISLCMSHAYSHLRTTDTQPGSLSHMAITHELRANKKKREKNVNADKLMGRHTPGLLIKHRCCMSKCKTLNGSFHGLLSFGFGSLLSRGEAVLPRATLAADAS